MITSHTENSLDIFNFSWVVVSQVKHSTVEKDFIFPDCIYFDICLHVLVSS